MKTPLKLTHACVYMMDICTHDVAPLMDACLGYAAAMCQTARVNVAAHASTSLGCGRLLTSPKAAEHSASAAALSGMQACRCMHM